MRGTAKVTISDEGRDKGKVFIITEMPASQSESWALRAILALMAGGVDLPEGFERMGMAGMAELGIKALAGLRWEVAEPLLAEMWQCVTIQPNPDDARIVRDLIEQDVEELATRIKLRAEVWNLHAGFLKAVGGLVSKS